MSISFKSASLLSNDLTVIEKWGKDNLVSFNRSKTKQAVISRKHNQNFPPVLMNGDELDTMMNKVTSINFESEGKQVVNSK